MQVLVLHKKRIAVLSLLVALALATNYMLFPFWNVKLMDFLIFTAGFLLGPIYGAAAGVLVWLVYGTLNPLGFNLFVLAVVAPLETLYGIGGGLLRKWGISPTKAAMIGLVATFTYDFVTNGLTGIIFYKDFLLGLKVGAPFALVHEMANAVIFATLAGLLYPRLQTMAIVKELS